LLCLSWSGHLSQHRNQHQHHNRKWHNPYNPRHNLHLHHSVMFRQ
jgi:hypothetical protein